MITLTASAATAVETLKTQKGAGDQHLRLFTEAGGCSGFEYGMSFAAPEDGDVRMESQGITFFVDKRSLEQLDGAEIHYDDGLMGKGFEIRNPNANSTCGCGRSFN